MREIAFAVVTATISVVAVFLPLAFLSDKTGRLFREFGVTVAAGCLIEILQWGAPARTAALLDVARNMAGSAAFLLLAATFDPRMAAVAGPRKAWLRAAAVLLIEPWLAARGERSLWTLLASGRGRVVLRLLLAGLVCGLLWEFWNRNAQARWIYTVVPGPTKAQAIRDTLTGPIRTHCPATALRQHPGSILYVDRDSASLL